MNAHITCTICNARFRISDTHPEMTTSDALRHAVREHNLTREDATTRLAGPLTPERSPRPVR